MSKPSSSLDSLKAHRSMLLACEAIGWLHMAGKAHPDFLRQHGGQKNGYEPKEWAKALVPGWDSTLSWLSNDTTVKSPPAKPGAY